MAYKIEFLVGSQTYVAAVENMGDYYIVFLEDDAFPYHVSPNIGIVSRGDQILETGSDVLLCRTAVELAKEFLEEETVAETHSEKVHRVLEVMRLGSELLTEDEMWEAIEFWLLDVCPARRLDVLHRVAKEVASKEEE